jgi:hypothetical protein
VLRENKAVKSAVVDPPKPEAPRPENRRPSFTAFRASDKVEIGLAGTAGEGEPHFLICYLGIKAGEVIELLAVDEEFHPGVLRKTAAVPPPSLLAYWPGTDDRIGTGFPRKQGDGHNFKTRVTVYDGTLIEIRESGFYCQAGEYTAPTRKRRPTHRPRSS